jgi:hypothetical protein
MMESVSWRRKTMAAPGPISTDDLRVLVTRAGMALSDEQMEAIRPLYDQYAASTAALHDLELGAEDPAVAFSTVVEPGDGAVG